MKPPPQAADEATPPARPPATATATVSSSFGDVTTAPGPARHARGWRLSTRMVVTSLVLLLVVQAAAMGLIHAAVERNARHQLSEQLQVGERIWARLLEQRAAKLTQGAALLAADFGFRDAASSGDHDTIVSALDNHGARIGARLAALLDTSFAVRAQGHGDSTGSAALLAALAGLAPELARSGSTVALVAGEPVQFVMVPMRAPVIVAWVVMGFELDRALVADLHAVSGLHGTLVAQSADGATRQLASSLPAERPWPAALGQDEQLGAGTFAGTFAGTSAGTVASSQATPRIAIDLRLADAPYLARPLELARHGPTRATLWLAGSLQEAVAPYRALQWALLALTAAGLLLFGAGSAVTARRITQPLRALARASERVGRGDYQTAVAVPARSGEVGELAGAFEHMRGNIAAQAQEVRRLAYWDRLNGLPNRLLFRDTVVQAIAAAEATAAHSGTPPLGLAVLMLDLDRFKHVNDVLGYAGGDRLLRGVAERLRQVVPEAKAGDTVARLGGDEFAVLLAPADAEAAQGLARRIAAVFETPLTLDDQTVDLSAGMGIACWPAHAREADGLLARAEVAMYAAKRSTAGARIYDDSLDSGSATTLSLSSELRRAIELGELRLFLQPKVALAGGGVIGAEALVRWQHPTRGLLPPMEFIPFAEQTGFVRHLTLWVFGEAAAAQRRLAGLGVTRISVNLSTRDLLDTELPDKLDDILVRHGAQPAGFCLEITESAIMDDPARAEATLNRLAARGFKLSIDDFGTGYSSLAYLKRLPVNELKIDKSFVMAMEREAGDEKIVRSTIDLAHNLGLTVVAEGVENAAVLEQLARLGCDEAQGYHLSRPLPCAAFESWARAQFEARASAQPKAAIAAAETVETTAPAH